MAQISDAERKAAQTGQELLGRDIEQNILADIGLPMRSEHYNGSGDCRRLRKEAARRLPEAIEKHLGIAADSGLVGLAQQAAEGLDTSDSQLQRTWEVLSDVIGVHVSAASGQLHERKASFDSASNDIVAQYGLEAPVRGVDRRFDAVPGTVVGVSEDKLQELRQRIGLRIPRHEAPESINPTLSR